MRRIVRELTRLARVEYHGWFIRRLNRKSTRAVRRHRRAIDLTRRDEQQLIKHMGALRQLTREITV